MNENNKVLKVLIMVVAIVVIIESIVIITRMTQGQSVTIMPKSVTPTVQKVESKEAKMMLAVNGNVVKGKASKLSLMVTPSVDLSVDAIDLYLKYDPTKVEVTKLNFVSGIKPTLNKISKDKGLIVVNYLITDKGGLKLTKGAGMNLVEADFVAKVAGETEFEITTGKSTSGSGTMIIENETSREIPFEVSPLKISVN